MKTIYAPCRSNGDGKTEDILALAKKDPYCLHRHSTVRGAAQCRHRARKDCIDNRYALSFVAASEDDGKTWRELSVAEANG